MSKKFATLGDLRGNDGHDSGGENSDDEEDRESFFVGGSEHSGQQVVGPPRPGDGNNVADKLFRFARQAGAETVASGETSRNNGSSSFSAGGMKLGDSVVASSAVRQEANDEGVTTADVRMITYENGFTIDDGEFRSFDDPASAAFLNDIGQGRIPRELIHAHHGRIVNLQMERRPGNYVPPKVKIFSGSGHRLGAPTPQVVEAPVQLSKEDAEKHVKEAQEGITLDDSQPITQLQIRLPDGRRLVAKFNTSANISLVRNFVVTAVPSLAFGAFELRTMYPNAVIEDEGKSIEGASLLNSVIIVRPV